MLAPCATSNFQELSGRSICFALDRQVEISEREKELRPGRSRTCAYFCSNRNCTILYPYPQLQIQTVMADSSVKDFESLGVSPFLVRSLASMSIRAPTAVQAACIPPILQGRDCIGSAQTGSGKTIAFALPMLQELAKDPFGIFGLVLTPTR